MAWPFEPTGSCWAMHLVSIQCSGTNSMHVAKQETSVQCRWMQQLQHTNIHRSIESLQLRVSGTAQDRGKADLDGLCST